MSRPAFVSREVGYQAVLGRDGVDFGERVVEHLGDVVDGDEGERAAQLLGDLVQVALVAAREDDVRQFQTNSG